MPDWTGSFHLPHMTDEEFKKARASYVANYGYRYSIPGFDDIFHLGIEEPMTQEEETIWKNKEFSQLSPERYEELKYIKKQRKEAYLDMLGSPQPEIFSSRGSLIGAIDDAQDALSTLCVVGLIALKLSPTIVQNAFLGPVGLLLTASEALNIINKTLTPERSLLASKKAVELHQEGNPKSSTMKVKAADKMKYAKFGQGAIIEALQVSDNVFGIGISLGAIMNVPADIIFATARSLPGYPPIPSLPIPDVAHWKRRGTKLLKAVGLLTSTEQNPFGQDYTQLMVAANAAAQLQNYECNKWNPLEEIPDIKNIQIKATEPSNILSIEAINEVDPEGLKAICWPTTGEMWSTTDDLLSTMPAAINKSLNNYLRKEQYSAKGMVGSVNSTEATRHMLEAVEGKGSVVIDYVADTKAITGLTNAGYTFPQDITDAQFARWQSFTASYEEQGSSPKLQDSLSYATNIAGFSFVKQIEAYR